MELTRYQLLLLDVMMGEISGFRMASLLKKDPATARIPIIFITAKDTENDTLTGFNLGADDYISKPFSLKEVSARVRAVLRSTAQVQTTAEEVLRYRGLTVNLPQKKVTIDGSETSLTKKEFEILALLLQHPGRIPAVGLLRLHPAAAAHSRSQYVQEAVVVVMEAAKLVGVILPQQAAVQSVNGLAQHVAHAAKLHEVRISGLFDQNRRRPQPFLLCPRQRKEATEPIVPLVGHQLVLKGPRLLHFLFIIGIHTHPPLSP